MLNQSLSRRESNESVLVTPTPTALAPNFGLGIFLRATISHAINGHGFLIRENLRNYPKLPEGP